MINYCRIAQKVWRFTSSPDADHHVQIEEMSCLDWQAVQWYTSVPEELKLPHPESITSASINNSNRRTWRLKSLLYLRGNMMRIMVHRRIFLKGEHISIHSAEALMVVNIAKASIRLLYHLDQVSDIYKLQQVTFNWFLVSALAVLFLAVAHAPARFSCCCKDEFYMALDLIEGFSMKSYVSRRLWRSIKNLRQLGPRMGLEKEGYASEPRQLVQGTDVMGGQELLGIPAVNTGPWLGDLDELQVDGMQMSRGLMDLYEAMGESASADGGWDPSHDGQWPTPGNTWFGNCPELASVLKDFI